VRTTAGRLLVEATSTGSELLDLAGVTPAELDDAATTTPGDAGDATGDADILRRIETGFNAGGHALTAGRYSTSLSVRVALKTGDVVRVAATGLASRFLGPDMTEPVGLAQQDYADAQHWQYLPPELRTITPGSAWELVSGYDVFVISAVVSGSTTASRSPARRSTPSPGRPCSRRPSAGWPG
jgi:hypothetical protein